MKIQRLRSGIWICIVSLLAHSAAAQKVFESQLLRFRTEGHRHRFEAAVGPRVFA